MNVRCKIVSNYHKEILHNVAIQYKFPFHSYIDREFSNKYYCWFYIRKKEEEATPRIGLCSTGSVTFDTTKVIGIQQLLNILIGENKNLILHNHPHTKIFI